MQSSNYVDSKMREIKSGAAILSLDRIAVMTALNLANEFLAEKTKTNSVIDSKSDEINQLTAKLDQALIRLKSINR
jgi:cell division protein ZapA